MTGKKDRLAPQPAKTAVARWVGRLVKAWPLALTSTVRTKDKTILRQAVANGELHRNNVALQRDMREMLTRIMPKPNQFRADVKLSVNDWNMEQQISTRVEFDPVHVNITLNRDFRFYEFAEYTKLLSRKVAREVSILNAKQVEDRAQIMLAYLFRNKLEQPK